MKILYAFAVAITASCLIAALIAFPTMWLINDVLSPSAIMAVFGVYHIGVWKSIGVAFLCSMLFKSSVSNSNKEK